MQALTGQRARGPRCVRMWAGHSGLVTGMAAGRLNVVTGAWYCSASRHTQSHVMNDLQLSATGQRPPVSLVLIHFFHSRSWYRLPDGLLHIQ